MMDKYYEKIYKRYNSLIIDQYIIVLVSLLILTLYHISLTELELMSILVAVTVMDIVFTYRLIVKYNVYFFTLINIIMMYDVVLVLTFVYGYLLPTLLAGLSYLFMLPTYIFSLVYFMMKYKPKLLHFDKKYRIINGIAVLLAILAILESLHIV
ncbi:hypothetical protein STK_11770 [Sulfurisphaera tokodaii str. 7]|uniref:Uncharacterized protein n=2 Tax=Sulfurisphaera tokodaii TaxID=111955 RepID=Q972F5_SULTO|nr:hypothetical protein STK_11770 [Sulfurisphaera tokodaii str. 7]